MSKNLKIKLVTLFQDFLETHRGRLFLFAPILFGLGIGTYFSLSKEPPIERTITALIACFIIWLLSLKTNREIVSKSLLGVLIFASGYTNIHLQTVLRDSPKIENELGVIWLRGNVERIENLEKYTRITIINNDLWQPETKKFAKEKTPVKIRLNVRTKIPEDLSVSDYIHTKVILTTPPDIPVYPGGYDFAKYSYFKQIGAVGYSISDIKIYKNNEPNFIEKVRESISRKVDEAIENKEQSSITKALIIADKSEIPKKVSEKIRGTGLGHLLAISGLHMSIVMIWTFAFVRILLTLSQTIALNFDTKKISAVFALIIGLSYLLITNLPISATRAYIMLSIFFIAILLDRNHVSLRPVALAAMIILIINPQDIVSPSFQLSFAAVAGLIGFYQKYREFFKIDFNRDESWVKKLSKYFIGIVITTVIAGFATAPIAIYHFNSFPKFGTLANLVGIPLTSLFVMPLLVIANILSVFGVEKIFYQLASYGIEGIVGIADYFYSIENSIINIPKMPSFFLPVAMVILFLAVSTKGKTGLYISSLLVIPILMTTFYRNEPLAVISNDGKLFAVKIEGSYKFIGNKRKSYVISQWMKKLGLNEKNKKEIYNTKFLNNCDKRLCEIGDLLITKSGTESDCKKYKLIFNINKNELNCDEAKVVNLKELKENGTHLIYESNKEYIVKNSMDYKGQRKW